MTFYLWVRALRLTDGPAAGGEGVSSEYRARPAKASAEVNVPRNA